MIISLVAAWAAVAIVACLLVRGANRCRPEPAEHEETDSEETA